MPLLQVQTQLVNNVEVKTLHCTFMVSEQHTEAVVVRWFRNFETGLRVLVHHAKTSDYILTADDFGTVVEVELQPVLKSGELGPISCLKERFLCSISPYIRIPF
jgi:hypothetical protein